MQTRFSTLSKIIFLTILFLTVSTTNISAATFTVTNINDSGAGSLRQAILDANTAASDDIVNFDASFNVPRTITLGGTQLLITGNGALTINGPGMNLLTVSGNDASRVFSITGANAGTITINSLTVALGQTVNNGDGGGAGINVNGTTFPPLSAVNLVVNNVFFRNNRAGVNDGGGIFGGTNCSLTVNNSVFTENSANNGNSIITGTNFGFCGTVNISNSTFYGPSASNSAAVYLLANAGSGAVFNVSGSSFYNTGSLSGSGVLFMATSSATPSTITNSTFYNNKTFAQATVALPVGLFNVTNITVAENVSAADNVSAGISTNNTTLNIGNSIVSGNRSPGGENNFGVNPVTPIVSQGYNIFGSSLLPAPVSGNTTGNQLGVNPLLDGLRSNGGLTKTLALRKGSPAIDTGNPTTFSATDQRGITRPQDGDGNGNARSDIGAYELRPTDVVPTDKADFDGDGKTDISIFRPNVGQWWYLRSLDNSNRAFSFGSSTDKIVPGDYTGDGKTDIATFTPSTGFWSILRSENSTFYGFPFGTNGDIAAPADYDGDGKTDAAVFRPSNVTWYISKSSGGTTITGFGASGDVPAVADYDGDGKVDIAIYRVALGQWWYLRSSDGTSRAFAFGTSTDKPMQGDYTGDGKADLAFFRPSSGQWFILRSEDSTFYGFPFGTTGDIPAAGDYDGDGRFDSAVFRPSNTTWYLNRSFAGTQIVGFGATNDIPVPYAFVQ